MVENNIFLFCYEKHVPAFLRIRNLKREDPGEGIQIGEDTPTSFPLFSFPPPTIR
jgi:hypothetical protein